MDLHEIANTPGFGSGKKARDILAAENETRAMLPDPAKLLPVMASKDIAGNWPIANFGYDVETDADWQLVTVDVRASETCDAALMQDAKSDAETIAAIVNAFRLGILVIAKEPTDE